MFAMHQVGDWLQFCLDTHYWLLYHNKITQCKYAINPKDVLKDDIDSNYSIFKKHLSPSSTQKEDTSGWGTECVYIDIYNTKIMYVYIYMCVVFLQTHEQKNQHVSTFHCVFSNVIELSFIHIHSCKHNLESCMWGLSKIPVAFW